MTYIFEDSVILNMSLFYIWCVAIHLVKTTKKKAKVTILFLTKHDGDGASLITIHIQHQHSL